MDFEHFGRFGNYVDTTEDWCSNVNGDGVFGD